MRRRSRFGTVVAIKDRDGYWCRWKQRVGTTREGKPRYRTHSRLGGRTKGAAERMLPRVEVLVQDGWDLQAAICHVWGEPQPQASELTFSELADQYLEAIAREKRKHRATRSRDEARVKVIQNAP